MDKLTDAQVASAIAQAAGARTKQQVRECAAAIGYDDTAALQASVADARGLLVAALAHAQVKRALAQNPKSKSLPRRIASVQKRLE